MAALITGASAGIGLELARVFAANKHDVVLVARRKDHLEKIAREISREHGVGAAVIAADLSRPEGAREVFEKARDLRIDILVNNAGFGHWGRFDRLGLEEQLGMVALNVTALTELTYRFLRAMAAAGRGRVLNVASTAAFQPGPYMAVYYATKAFVLSFSEALSEEFRGTGVTVTALCPGPTASEFQARAKMEDSPLLKLGVMSSASVAAAAYTGLVRGHAVVVPGFQNRMGVQALRISPRAVVRRVIGAIQKKSA